MGGKKSIKYPAASSGVFRAKPNYFLRGKPRGIYPERIKNAKKLGVPPYAVRMEEIGREDRKNILGAYFDE